MKQSTKYQIYLPKSDGTGEWTNLKEKITLPDGRVVKTKLLVNGDLQGARRTGQVGIFAADKEYKDGEPKIWQWRQHPAQLAVSMFAFSRAPQPPRRDPQVIPAGVEFES